MRDRRSFLLQFGRHMKVVKQGNVYERTPMLGVAVALQS
jgi:hypothetical protein